jgi:uncharacterized protein YndB with AHSA1/START domain
MTDISLDTVLRVQRRLPYPCERVYDAWTRPDAWKHWFCVPGEGYSGRMTDFACEPGGAYRAEMRNPNDATVIQSGVFQAIGPLQRLVFTHLWETSVFGDDVDYDETLVAVDFEASGETTVLTLTHLGFPNEAIRDEHLWGWEGCLDSLERHLASKTARF